MSGCCVTSLGARGNVEKCMDKDSDQYAEKSCPGATTFWTDSSTFCGFTFDSDDEYSDTMVFGARSSRRTIDFDYVPEEDMSDDELLSSDASWTPPRYEPLTLADSNAADTPNETTIRDLLGHKSYPLIVRNTFLDVAEEPAVGIRRVNSAPAFTCSATCSEIIAHGCLDHLNIIAPSPALFRPASGESRSQHASPSTECAGVHAAEANEASNLVWSKCSSHQASKASGKEASVNVDDGFASCGYERALRNAFSEVKSDERGPQMLPLTSSPWLGKAGWQFDLCDEVEAVIENRFSTDYLDTKFAALTPHHPDFEDRLPPTASDLDSKQCQGESEGQVEEGAHRSSWSLGTGLHLGGTCTPCRFWLKDRCANGINCNFCHADHDVEDSPTRKRRSKKFRDRLRKKLLGTVCDEGANHSATPPSQATSIPAMLL